MGRLVNRLKRAQQYDPVVVDALVARLKGGGMLSRSVNFSLWVTVFTGRRVLGGVRVLRHGIRGRRGPKRAPTDFQPGPLTAVSASALGRRVLIIAELSLPQCRRYRVDQKVEMLQALGYDVTVISWKEHEKARRAMQVHGLVLFYRVPAFPNILTLMDEARRLNVTAFFDIDDLIFDVEEYARNTSVQNLPKRERKLLLDGGVLYRTFLKACGNGIASTDMIARHMRDLGTKTVYVVENALDEKTLRVMAEMDQRPPQKPAGQIVIGYGSGTTTHDSDFAEVAEALMTIMDRFPEVVLAIHGYLTLPPAFDRLEGRIYRVPFLDMETYLRAVASWDISIAPLEKTVFNEAKSNIKYLEASVMGVPSVCSPAEPFASVIRDGETGYVARDTETWVTALSALVADADLRRRVAAAARDAVLARYHPAAVSRTQMAPILDHLPPAPASDKLQVLMVNLLFPPLSFGGATVVVENLARCFDRDAVDLTVFTGLLNVNREPYDWVRYEAAGVPVIGMAVPPMESREQEYRDPEMVDHFAEILETVRPQVVHFHSIQQLSAGMAEACVSAGIPYVITIHDAWWICERQFMIRPDNTYCGQTTIDLKVCAGCVADSAFTYKRFHYLSGILEQAALLLTPSAFQRDLMLANGWPADTVRVNENGVLLPQRPRTPRRPGSPVRFAYLGGPAVQKGYFWLKQIMEGLSERNWTLTITDIMRRLGGESIRAGDWKTRGKIRIVPPFDQANMDAFYDGIDVLLVPSLWKESFGLVVREALARDIWVIATDSGGVTEAIVENENGNVVPLGDTAAFTTAVRAILAAPERLDGYSNPYRDRVRNYDAQARDLADHLRGAAGTRAGAG